MKASFARGVALAFVLSLANLSGAWGLDPAPAVAGARVDVNAATQAQLEALPGVGPTTAQAIVAARPFSSIDDLAKVKGIGPVKLASLRNLVTVGGLKATSAMPPVPHAPTPAVPTRPASLPASLPVPAPPQPNAAPSHSMPQAPAAMPPISAVNHAAGTAAPKIAPGQRVNVNSASLAELEALPGIGPVKAQKIIAGRPYAKPEDVMKVSGIKEGTFAKIKDWITVQ